MTQEYIGYKIVEFNDYTDCKVHSISLLNRHFASCLLIMQNASKNVLKALTSVMLPWLLLLVAEVSRLQLMMAARLMM